jgi:diguanylate cyclase (GGDEF)-like protein
VKELDTDYIRVRLTTYIIPAVPRLMVTVGVAIGLLWFTYLGRGLPNLLPLALTCAVGASLLILLGFALNYTASHGMSTATGFVGIVYVSVLATQFQIATHLSQRPAETTIPYTLILAFCSISFWPKHWHMVVGVVCLSLPSVIQMLRTDHLERTTYFYAQLGIVSFATIFTLYHLIWNANLRMFRLAQEIEYRAYHDALTGLHNRSRWFEIALDRHATMGRMMQPCCLLYVDIDRFKSINDQYGHDVGDQILQEVTKVLSGNTREADVIARFGGEEFVVLLPGIDLAGAIACAQRLHQSIRSITLLPTGVTVSIGIAESLPPEELDVLINRADHALLQAKTSGRNRTVIASGESLASHGARQSPPFANAFGGSDS